MYKWKLQDFLANGGNRRECCLKSSLVNKYLYRKYFSGMVNVPLTPTNKLMESAKSRWNNTILLDKFYFVYSNLLDKSTLLGIFFTLLGLRILHDILFLLTLSLSLSWRPGIMLIWRYPRINKSSLRYGYLKRAIYLAFPSLRESLVGYLQEYHRVQPILLQFPEYMEIIRIGEIHWQLKTQ